MPIWRNIDVHPNGGFSDQPWMPDPEDDTFARAAQRVTWTYSASLPEFRLPLPVAHLQLSLYGDPARVRPAQTAVRVTELGKDGHQFGHIDVAPGFRELTSDARALLVLDVLDSAASQLAELANWEDRGAVAQLRELALAAGLQHWWEGPWKTSPDRKRKARMLYTIAEDGLGRGRVQVLDGTELLNGPALYCPPGYRYVAKKLRWEGAGEVSVDGLGPLPLAPPPGTNPARRLEELVALAPAVFRVDDLQPVEGPCPSIDAATSRPTVVVSAPPARTNLLRAGGVSRGFQASRAMYSVMTRQLERLNGPEWQEWWSAADLGDLNVRCLLEGGRDPREPPDTPPRTREVLVRQDQRGLEASLTLPYPALGSDHAAIGQDAVAELMERVRKRTALPPHPPIPRVEVDEELVATDEREDREREQGIAMLELALLGLRERELGVGVEPAPAITPDGFSASTWRRVEGTNLEPAPPIQFSGGMTTVAVPPLYTQAITQYFHLMCTTEWEQWWTAADLGPLRLSFVNMPWKDGALYQVQKARGGIGGTVRRPIPTFPEALPDCTDFADFARADVTALVEKLRARGKLGPPPALPRIEIDTAALEAAEADHAAEIARLVQTATPPDP